MQPYVTYIDNVTQHMIVEQYNGVIWVQINNDTDFGSGGSGLNAPQIDFDNTGKLYIAFDDSNTSDITTSIKKYDGESWNYLGMPGLNESSYTSNPVLKINPNNNIPYIAFYNLNSSSRIEVMQFDGINWQYVGNHDSIPKSNGSISLTFDPTDNQPIIAYTNILSASVATVSVLQYNSTNWVYVGAQNFNSSSPSNQTAQVQIEFNPISHQPYVLFQDFGSYNTIVKYFDGTNWLTFGEADFSALYSLPDTGWFGMHFGNDGRLYVAFTSRSNSIEPIGVMSYK